MAEKFLSGSRRRGPLLLRGAELREIMTELGFKTVDEMVGRMEQLDVRDALDHWKAKGATSHPFS